MIRCCKDCQDRCLHCHSICEKYIAEKKEHDKQRKEQQETHYADYFDYKQSLKRKYWR